MWILREIIARGGEVNFHQFMELALYHRKHGYYTRTSTPWGRSGDFLTAPTASGWYARVCAGLFRAIAKSSGEPLELVDLAAGDGSFLTSVIAELGDQTQAVLARVVAVDRSEKRRSQIGARLTGGELAIHPVGSLGEIASSAAVVHASELYDAMPVHRVEQTAGGLMELNVAVAGDRLEWRRRPAAWVLEEYLAGHGITLVDGQIAEINLDAEPYHRRLLSGIGKGVSLVLDYGYPAARLYDPRGKLRGSLATYHQHELGSDPLETPGERDLTAHVNFDDLRRAATGCGWEEIGLMPLAEFLVRAGLGAILEERGLGMEAELDAETVSARQEIKQLLDPEGMGSDLKMLIQGKGRLGEIVAEVLNRPV